MVCSIFGTLTLALHDDGSRATVAFKAARKVCSIGDAFHLTIKLPELPVEDSAMPPLEH